MKFKKIISVFVVLILLCGLGFGVYVKDYYHADKYAIQVFNEVQEHVEIIDEENQIVFIPDNPIAGFIFYPGGKVEHQAYIPLMNELANQGVLCVLVQMPFNLAVFNMSAANGIQEDYEIEKWYIGGHSLGGAMAASYVSNHLSDYEGLVLLAAYSTSDLSQSNLDVLSIYGSEDNIMNKEKYEEYSSNLPINTEIIIEGGNHAGFGDYGHQEGDGVASITNKKQIQLTSEEIIKMIRGSVE